MESNCEILKNILNYSFEQVSQTIKPPACMVFIRGEVEATRLEAKAKNTKKFRGQSQGPRTQPQVFSKKKKVFKIFFRAISKKKDLQKIFSDEKRLQKLFSGDLYLRKPKKGFCRFSARFLAFSNEISTVQI